MHSNLSAFEGRLGADVETAIHSEETQFEKRLFSELASEALLNLIAQ